MWSKSRDWFIANKQTVGIRRKKRYCNDASIQKWEKDGRIHDGECMRCMCENPLKGYYSRACGQFPLFPCHKFKVNHRFVSWCASVCHKLPKKCKLRVDGNRNVHCWNFKSPTVLSNCFRFSFAFWSGMHNPLRISPLSSQTKSISVVLRKTIGGELRNAARHNLRFLPNDRKKQIVRQALDWLHNRA